MNDTRVWTWVGWILIIVAAVVWLVGVLLHDVALSRTISIGQSDAGTERIYTTELIDTTGFTQDLTWHVEGKDAVIYGMVKLDYCMRNGILTYAITVDSVRIR